MLSVARFVSRRLASNSSALVKPKRFYKKAVIVQESDASGYPLYKVTLDGRVIKTQAGQPLAMSSEPLALAIAQEWKSQEDEIEIGLMRLTGLAMTSIDNPLNNTKDTIADKVMGYLTTDTVLYYAPENERLMEAQRQYWDPVLRATNEDMGTALRPVADLMTFDPVSEEDKKRFRSWLMSYNFWALNGMQYAVESSKSVLLPLGLVRHRLSVEEAVRLALLEQEIQAEQWGQVEWAHGMDKEDLGSRLAAATLFVHLNSNHFTSKSLKA